MPELPEVETVRRGLAPYVEGARIASVTLGRPDLRFPFPERFAERLAGATIVTAGRRAKYLLFALSSGETWLSHLGMTGSFRFASRDLSEPSRYRAGTAAGRHDHVVLDLDHPRHGALSLIYADPRRFGFMDLMADPDASPWLAGLGPEPLGNSFSGAYLAARLAGRRAPVKAALLDQRVVAGLGNIYAAEALWRARIHPERTAGHLSGAELERLVAAVRAVLEDAIAAGGSTISDYRNADGGTGYFQHSFDVYDREGAPCRNPACGGTVRRGVQSGRSSFYCPRCQRAPRARSGKTG